MARPEAHSPRPCQSSCNHRSSWAAPRVLSSLPTGTHRLTHRAPEGGTGVTTPPTQAHLPGLHSLSWPLGLTSEPTRARAPSHAASPPDTGQALLEVVLAPHWTISRCTQRGGSWESPALLCRPHPCGPPAQAPPPCPAGRACLRTPQPDSLRRVRPGSGKPHIAAPPDSESEDRSISSSLDVQALDCLSSASLTSINRPFPPRQAPTCPSALNLTPSWRITASSHSSDGQGWASNRLPQPASSPPTVPPGPPLPWSIPPSPLREASTLQPLPPTPPPPPVLGTGPQPLT